MKPLTIFRILKYPAPTIINILLFLFHLPTPISFLARKRVLKQTPHIISFHMLKNSMYLEQLFLQLTTILPPSIKLNINFLLSNNKYSSTFPTCSKMSFQGCVLCCAESFSCVRLCDPMDCSPCQAPLSMGILQARILEQVAMPFSRGHPNPGIEPRSSTLQADSLPSDGLYKSESNKVHIWNWDVMSLLIF